MNAEHSDRLTKLLSNQRGCGMPAARELARTMDRIRKRERATVEVRETQVGQAVENFLACLLIIAVIAVGLLV